jgi:hypothetical protein
MSQILISLNFWEYKQLEYWLKDNCPIATTRSMYDKFTSPEEEELYAVEGTLDNETICMLKLKYGNRARIR